MKADLFLAAVVIAIAATASPLSLGASDPHSAEQKRPDRRGQPQPKAPANLAGLYECEGTSLEGHSYRGVVDIVRLVGQWTAIAADGHVYTERLTRIGPGSGRLYFRVEPHTAVTGTMGDHRRPA